MKKNPVICGIIDIVNNNSIHGIHYIHYICKYILCSLISKCFEAS